MKMYPNVVRGDEKLDEAHQPMAGHLVFSESPQGTHRRTIGVHEISRATAIVNVSTPCKLLFPNT